jgi:hypothetical protein
VDGEDVLALDDAGDGDAEDDQTENLNKKKNQKIHPELSKIQT